MNNNKKKELEKIKYNPSESKYEKTLKISNDEIIANAIKDILKRESEYGTEKKH